MDYQSMIYLLMDHVPQNLALIQRGTVIYVNQQMHQILGYDLDELLGKTLDTILFPAVGLSNQSEAEECFLIHKNGSIIPGPVVKLSAEDTCFLIHPADSGAALRQQLSYMAGIIRDSSLAIIGTDLEGKILSWNHAAADVYGYPAADVIGRNISIIMPPDLQFSLVNEIIHGKAPQKRRTYAWTKQGILVNVEISMSPIMDDQESIIGISFFSRDITLDKIAEQKIYYQARLLESVNDSIIGARFDGTIEYWNQGSENLFGLTAEEVIGKDFTSLFVDNDFNEIFNNLNEISSGRWVGIKQVHIANQASKYVRLAINTIYDEMDQPFFLAITFTDISEIVESRLKAEEAVRSTGEFMANISHEIRTPMSGVIGYTELLIDKDLDLEAKKYVLGIKQNADQLMELINDYLDLSKLEAESMVLYESPFNIRKLIFSCVEVFAPLTQKKNLVMNVNIDQDVPFTLCGDAKRIRQVINNLLANGVKFTSTGAIDLEVSITGTIDDTETGILLEIRVRDTGIGIPADKLSEIFTPFTQVDSSKTRKYGGTGLGLAISKHLVELMKGKLSVDSALGKGSQFTMTLPLTRHMPKLNQAVLEQLPLPDRKLLIVTDNVLLADQLKQRFHIYNFVPIMIDFQNRIESFIYFHQPWIVIIDLDQADEERKYLIRNLKRFLDHDRALVMIYSNHMDRNSIYEFGGMELLNGTTDEVRLGQIMDQYFSGLKSSSSSIAEKQIRSVLIIDKNQVNLILLGQVLRNAGLDVHTALNIPEAVRIMKETIIAMIFLDVDLVSGDEDLIQRLHTITPESHIIGLSYDDLHYNGMDEYIYKPYTSTALLGIVSKYF